MGERIGVNLGDDSPFNDQRVTNVNPPQEGEVIARLSSRQLETAGISGALEPDETCSRLSELLQLGPAALTEAEWQSLEGHIHTCSHCRETLVPAIDLVQSSASSSVSDKGSVWDGTDDPPEQPDSEVVNLTEPG